MKNYLLLIVALASIFFSGCSQVKVKGEGPVTQQTRQVEPFTKLSIYGNIKVEYTSGSETYVSVEAQQNLLDLITTTSVKGSLDLKTKGNLTTKEDIKVFITAPSLVEIDLSGNTQFIATNNLQVEKLQLSANGNTKVDLELNASEMTLEASGKSKVNLKGFSDEFRADVSGDSDLNAMQLATIKARVDGSGNSNIRLHVKKELKAEVSGSSKITYKGDPNKDFDISGDAAIDQR